MKGITFLKYILSKMCLKSLFLVLTQYRYKIFGNNDDLSSSIKFFISQEKIENGTSTVENEKEEEKKSKKIFNPKKIKILIAVMLGHLFLGSSNAMMAPIFPPKAEEKNASPLAYGFVFGVSYLTVLIFSPVYGKLIPILKPRFMMKAGILLPGFCNILFGLLDYAPAGPAFIGLALILRFLHSLGACAYFTASYAVLGCELSDIIGRAMSLAETANSLGLTFGPVFGGFFFQLGGFQLPFIVLGLILIAVAVINCFLFSGDDSDVPGQSISVLKLIKDIDFMIDIIAMSSGFALLAFNEISLEPHVRQFNPSAVTTGFVFLTAGLSVAVFSPVCGYFAEKVSNALYFTFLGSLIFVIYFLIIGPASFLNFKTTLWYVIASQVLIGLAEASVVVCSFIHGMKHTVERGFPDEVGTYGAVSGVMLSASCFGGFIGPSLGGVLIDEIGYINTTMVAAGLGTMIALICAGRLAHLFFKKRR